MSIAWKESCIKMVHGVCPLCGADDAKNICNAINFAGATLEVVKTGIVMCNQCGFVYTDPKPSFSDINRYYKYDPHSSGRVYHERKKGSIRDKLATQRAEYILRHNIRRGGRFLDIGCGSGDLLIWLKMNTDFELSGLEPSEEALEIESKFGIRVIHSTLEDADLSSIFGKVDAIALMSILEHVYHPAQFLAITKNLLKRDGFLFIEVPDSKNPLPALVEFFDYEHLSHFTMTTLRCMLHKVGMNVYDIDERALTEGRISICAVRSRESVSNVAISEDTREMLRNIHRYRQEKRALEKAFISRITQYFEKWEKLHSRVAVYGAGGHTLHVLKLVDISDFVCCLLDSDQKKHGKKYMRWRIYGPTDIESLNLDAILISSQKFEDEIYESIKHYKAKGLDIIKCYS